MTEYKSIFEQVRKGSRKLSQISDSLANKILQDLADIVILETSHLLKSNELDCSQMNPENPMLDRLLLTQERILSIASEIRQVGKLPSPLHLQLEQKILANGLNLEKITVPIALKSGNGLILKGGTDATHSNQAIIQLIHQALKKNNVPVDAFQLLPPDRAATQAMLEAVGFVDVIIPRGSQGLIEFVRANAKVPVIETGAGIVHTYVDSTADLSKAKRSSSIPKPDAQVFAIR
ncbi:putative gamma-glutamyl phosphate reductase-like [Daphnia sinensis]|uniref:Gamma-glutamyl phosphate reductase-like n=1 Tax=Daphnia sinensis TaxID=1820382 RepID=A0AAD5KDS3_9CRUS|nr:putative gamma-glutamyl phosphate reductase-like [Daphnia sinensis]